MKTERRRFIRGIAAAGVGALAYSKAERFASSVLAQTSEARQTSLIDVHHHFIPPFYVAENRERILASGGGQNPAWWN
jgi:6-methylsalicylate decarboxylase